MSAKARFKVIAGTEIKPKTLGMREWEIIFSFFYFSILREGLEHVLGEPFHSIY